MPSWLQLYGRCSWSYQRTGGQLHTEVHYQPAAPLVLEVVACLLRGLVWRVPGVDELVLLSILMIWAGYLHAAGHCGYRLPNTA